MNKIDILRMAGKNLWRRKIRTFLTVLGVVIGTTSIIVMLSLGIGLTESTKKNMERWGSLTMIQVRSGMSYDEKGNPLGEPKHLNDDLVKEFKGIDGVIAVSPAYEFHSSAKMGRMRGGLQLIGLDPDAMSQLEYEASSGRLLQSGDRNVIVVGQQVIRNFNDEAFLRKMEKGMMMGPMVEEEKDPTEMMDQRISMKMTNNRGQKKMFNFMVVGILEGEHKQHSYQSFAPIEDIKKMKKFMEQGQNGSSRVVREVSINGSTRSSSKSRKAAMRPDPNDYDYILVRTKDIEDTKRISKSLQEQGYNSWSMANQLEGIEKSARIIQAILGGIGGVTLLVAALGIINTMIMSIYERTREIGIMKVIGATFTDVYSMFLTEAGLIGFFGGLVGISFSYIVSFIINQIAMGYMNRMGPGEEVMKFSIIPPWLALFALGFAIVIGVVAGLYPAHRAVRLSPINAIRNE